ncbi:MAG: PIN domain-containing protein [Vicinamibacterales bacterium]
MKAFFDTSVLVPVFYGDHEHHDASLAVFVRYAKDDAFCGAHSLAEVYSTLTGMPGKYRVTGDQAMLFVGTILERLNVIALSAEEYGAAIETWSKLGITGGTIYDALLASCALKAEVGVIYSWNGRHYRQLGPEVEGRLRLPR